MAFSSKQMLVLVLVLVQGSINSQAKTVEEPIEMANEAGAPFTPEAVKIMKNTELWGAKREDRSDDIVIINTSGIAFASVFHACSKGSLSPDLLAEETLKGHTSTVFGAQSFKVDEYAYIKCELPFVGEGAESYFRIELESNVSGGIDVKHQFSSNLIVSDTIISGEKGKNNQVIIRVIDKV